MPPPSALTELSHSSISTKGLTYSNFVQHGNSPSPAEKTKPLNGPGLLHRSLLNKPIEVLSASGSYLTLLCGRQILDGCAGAAVAVIGHGHPQAQKAMLDQMSMVSYVHTMSYTTQSAERLANFMVEKGRPFGLSKAYFVGSGSEAMDSAMKMARQFFFEKGEKQRTRFVSRRQGYHGNTIGAMSISSNISRKLPYEGAVLLHNVSFVNSTSSYRGQRPDESAENFAKRLVMELDCEFQQLGPDTVIAFVAETVVGATSGCTLAPIGYFEGVRKLCDKYGILLILDEVMSGTGRTGTYFAFEQERGDIVPDIVTVGKGVGGGYTPIGGMLIHEKVVDVLRMGSGSFNHGHTYQAHPSSCATAFAVQMVMEEENLVKQCAKMGILFEQLLRDSFGDCKYVGDIRGRGLFWALEFVRDRDSKESFNPALDFGGQVQRKAFDLGLAVYPGKGTVDGYTGDHVLLAPPLNVHEEDLKRLVYLLKEAYILVEFSVLIS